MPPLSVRRLIGFSTTNFGKSLFWTGADIFCLVYATDTLKLDPAFAGAIILLTLVWDAVSDPLAGAMIDRFPSLSRRYGLLIQLAAPLTAVLLVLTFMSQFLAGAAGTAMFVVGLLGFRTAFTFCDIPDNALFARVARDKRDRVMGASFRKLMATLASVSLSLSSGWAFDGSSSLPEGIRILIVVLVAGLFGTLTLATGSAFIRHWDKSERKAAQPALFPMTRLLRQPEVAGLVLHMFLSSLAISIFMSALVYYARFVLGQDTWFATAMTTLLVCQGAGIVAWGWHAAKGSTIRTLTISSFGCAMSTILFVSSSAEWILIASCGAFGFCAGGLNTLRWALAAAVIDSVESSLNNRHEGLAMALFSLSIKSAVGVSAMLIGVLLSVVGYEPGNLAASAQSTGFRYVLAGTIVAAILGSIFPLSPRSVQNV